MNASWEAYLNGKVMAEQTKLYPGHLAFLRFLPDPELGMVVIVPAKSEKEYGAVPLQYTGTLNGAIVNLRLALKRMEFEPQKGRQFVFPVIQRPSPQGQTYLAFLVKGAQGRPARRVVKASAQPAAAPPPAGPAAAAPATQPEPPKPEPETK